MPENNLNKIISETAARLAATGIDDGAVEAELVLCELLNVDRLRLYLQGPKLLNQKILDKFEAIIEKRLTRYPLQYILDSAWFFGRKFFVNKSVMIPCPETELLLDAVLRAARHSPSDPVRLLDVGTGSGIVAISSKLENRSLDVTALDISPEALEVAGRNARQYKVADEIKFLHSDLFSMLDQDRRYDIIASNPPYITDGEYDGLPPEVKADPKLALLAGAKGLDIIDRMIKGAPPLLNRPGFLMFEIGYNQAQEIMAMIKDDGRYDSCSLIKDLNDIDRIIICKIK